MPSSIEPHGGWHVVLVLCSDVRRCAATCIAAGRASDVYVRACWVCRAHGTLACGCVATCRPGTIACEVHRRRICHPPVDKRCARRQPVYISL